MYIYLVKGLNLLIYYHSSLKAAGSDLHHSFFLLRYDIRSTKVWSI